MIWLAHSICASHVVLVFAALFGQVTLSLQCSINGTGMVYLKHTVGSSLRLLTEMPSLNTINISNQQNTYCMSNDGREYLFASFDDALWMVENLRESNGSSFLIALLGTAGTRLAYQMQESHVIANLTSFVLQSVGKSSSVYCNGSDVSLSLSNMCSVAIQAVSLIGCGSVYNGSLSIENAQSTTMADVLIQEGVSSGIQINVLSFPPFCDSNGTSFVLISNSTLINNGRKPVALVNELYGGGIAFRASVNVEVSIVSTKFIENNASIGAGLAYSAFNSDESFLNVINCEFIGNHANIHGGSAYLFGTKISFVNTVFTNNSAVYTAGGIYQFIPLSVQTVVQIEYKGCHFDGNCAQGSSGLLLASSIASFFNVNNQNQTVDIVDSVFSNNKAPGKQFFGQTTCTIHSDDVFLNFKNTNFSNNSATAVCVESSKITISGLVVFEHNNGYLGGAINTIRSLIEILPNATVHFIGNRAAFGGAIYEDGIREGSASCLFDIPEDRNNYYNVTFQNNKALSRGHSIYYLYSE